MEESGKFNVSASTWSISWRPSALCTGAKSDRAERKRVVSDSEKYAYYSMLDISLMFNSLISQKKEETTFSAKSVTDSAVA